MSFCKEKVWFKWRRFRKEIACFFKHLMLFFETEGTKACPPWLSAIFLVKQDRNSSSSVSFCRCSSTVLPWTVDALRTWWTTNISRIPPAGQGPPTRGPPCCPCTVPTCSLTWATVPTAVWVLQAPAAPGPVPILQQRPLSSRGKRKIRIGLDSLVQTYAMCTTGIYNAALHPRDDHKILQIVLQPSIPSISWNKTWASCVNQLPVGSKL